MNISTLIGENVFNTKLHQYGRIIGVSGEHIIRVQYRFGDPVNLEYPTVFESGILVPEHEEVLEIVKSSKESLPFERFRTQYSAAIGKEIDFLFQIGGGKRYRAVDGKLIGKTGNAYQYCFDTDTELFFADDTKIRIRGNDNNWTSAIVISSDNFTIVIQTEGPILGNLSVIEFTADAWKLLDALKTRIESLPCIHESIPYQLVCQHDNLLDLNTQMLTGQDAAVKHVMDCPITFIWGPPGTGKTETLARIAAEFIAENKRVLMVSHSNVSVDEALLRIANRAYSAPGKIVRYGYPRNEAILDDPEKKLLTSYQLAIHENPKLEKRYEDLTREKASLSRRDPRLLEVNKELAEIRNKLKEKEKRLIHHAQLVATTISKATVDPAIFEQKFDLVMFDEASMALVPQIVYAGSLASDRLCVFGDFQQLPAIVQSNNELLSEDIYSYARITDAFGMCCYHEWLVMLDEQHRMHKDIADFVSRMMYQNLLRTAKDVQNKRQEIAQMQPFPGHAMGMMDLSGMYSVCTKTMDQSRVNIFSAFVAAKIAEQIGLQEEVGVITPYSAQARLILTIFRDLQQEEDIHTTAATVHQFQGSEKTVIVYDAVDCYWMPYPGVLLTGNNANRLFNVAMTRAEGKFILICNRNYFIKKHVSRDLLFEKAMEELHKYSMTDIPDEEHKNFEEEENHKITCLGGEALLNTLNGSDSTGNFKFLNNTDAWTLFIKDLKSAKRSISIMIPGEIEDDDNKLKLLFGSLKEACERDIEVKASADSKISLPDDFKPYLNNKAYVNNPITLIDGDIIWFGEPLYRASYITKNGPIPTIYYPCVRFRGRLTCRMISAILES